MVDLHSHLVPNIDDGSKSFEQTIDFLKSIKGSGLNKIAVTPHFKQGLFEPSFDIFENNLNILKEELKNHNLNFELVKGWEIFLEASVLDFVIKNKMTYENSQYMLVETNRDIFPNNLHAMLYKLLTNGFKPILAHPERYNDVINDVSLVEDLIHKNTLIQINAGSLFNFFGSKSRETAWKLIEKGWVHIIASDTHCHMNDFYFSKAYELIKENIDEYTANLLFYDNPQKVLNNDKIELFYVDEVIKQQPKNLKEKFIKFLSKLRK